MGQGTANQYVTLRDYQLKDLEQLRAALREHRSVLYVAPCGSGKGTLITYIVNRCVEQGRSVIFGVRGRALVNDMSERVSRLGIQHGVLLGGHKRERWHPVQVCSIDTLHRMDRPPKADLIICDEAHMSASPTWVKTIERYPQAKLVGLTATPCRLDGRGLGELFSAMVQGPSEQDLIDQQYLVRSRVLAPPPPADLGSVKKTAGEFNAKQLAQVCDKATVIGDIVKHWRKHASESLGKTAAFGVDQAHANHIAEQFREAGYEWAYVDAETPDKERAQIWRDLDHGTLRGVASCGCISIGWDHPVVSCLIAARKTASLGLWRQMLGRGSRPYPGKDSFLVLDHVGNTHLHQPYGMFEDRVPWSLDGEPVRGMGETAESVTTCKACYATFKTGPRVCPYCGAMIVVKPRKVHVKEADLVEVHSAPAPVLWDDNMVPAPPSAKADFLKLLQKQEERGYKKNFAQVAFRMRHGFWPPKKWKEELMGVTTGVTP
jgi:DNA repair protein RadD